MKKILMFLFAMFICVGAIAHTINWYANGQVVSTTSCQSGDNITPPTAPAKTGYHFVRWEPGYTELEYIESTGTQYIDTGYKPKTGDKIRIVYQYDSLYGPDGIEAVSIFGCTDEASAVNAGNGVARVIQGTDASNRIAWGNGTNSIIGALTYNNATGVWYDLVCDNGVFTINDTQLGTISANSFSANFSMYLFARNTGGTAGLITKGKIQIAQVWDNGTLVRNLIPAKHKSDNVVGMYDTVSKQFFTNAGTGEFIAGPEVGDLQ